ncbi:MAG: hypothetical protein RMJ15_09590 [Nitrososphaerota archaeon]|nr:hypothetical protein [Candidatus Bathyarchaeota archaeon]MDW8023968.1 hypothetical protein [Nitrososphaerota archaeon]
MTAIAVAHLIDALNALLFNNPAVLLRLYPLAADKLEAITPTTYFLTFAFATFILWGITCAIAFKNPVETLVNNILSEAKNRALWKANFWSRKASS